MKKYINLFCLLSNFVFASNEDALKAISRFQELPLFLGEKVFNVASSEEMGQKFSVFSTRGSRYKAIEDRWTVAAGKTGIKYFAVYDGHGGPEVSELLKNELHIFLDERREIWQNDPRKIADLFLEFDTETRKLKNYKGQYVVNPGSTAVMMIDIPGNENLLFINLGDSVALAIKKNGDVFRSIDHDPDNKTEKTRVEALGGCVWKGSVADGKVIEGTIIANHNPCPYGIGMSRAFGDSELKHLMTVTPDIYTLPRESLAFAILMSDGVGEALSNNQCQGASQEINDLFKRWFKSYRKNLAHIYHDKKLKNMGTDDITMLVIPIDKSENDIPPPYCFGKKSLFWGVTTGFLIYSMMP